MYTLVSEWTFGWRNCLVSRKTPPVSPVARRWRHVVPRLGPLALAMALGGCSGGNGGVAFGAIVACTALVAAGVFLWKRHVRLTHVATARNEATRLLAAGQSRDALSVLSEGKRWVTDPETRVEWGRLEIVALERLEDVAGLAVLFDETPRAFAGPENASISAGRVQIEGERFEAYRDLRDLWRGHERRPEAWLALDVDALLAQDDELTAVAQLEGCRFEGERDAERLARLALMRLGTNPAEAQSLMSQAVEAAPGESNIRMLQGAFHESRNEYKQAFAAFQAALRRNPHNPFARDHLAEFYRRHGKHLRAVETWREALVPPSTDYIWLKALFWRRITVPLVFKLDVLKPPPGAARPVIDFLLGLNPDRFWDHVAFEPMARRNPELLSRQAVFWLRVLQSLQDGQDVEALALLNVGGFGSRSWHAPLERALICILTYRRSGFPTPSAETEPPPVLRPETRESHPFFAAVEGGPMATAYRYSEPQDRLLKGPHAFAAACYAAGWEEAARKLLRTTEMPDYAPDWYRQAVAETLARCAAAAR